jgi:putative nucleotidyltransferase with HDIG domain
LNQLNKQLTESFHKVLKLLVNLLEMRSKELCGHSKRVAAASRYIAAEMALSDRELDTIEIAALLHDIGKINLPEKLIAKSDSLMSPEELNLWRQHPLLGERALANIEQLMEVRRIIRHHHENYIGNGYPDGLRGEEIPLASRIIAVTDNYDKMANKVYMNVDNTRLRAMKAIRLKAGVELDGQIVRKLMDLLQKQKEKEKVKTKRELEIKPFELKENMILSRDLYTSRGVLVYPKDKRLDTVDIQAILETDKLEKLFTSVFVLL